MKESGEGKARGDRQMKEGELITHVRCKLVTVFLPDNLGLCILLGLWKFVVKSTVVAGNHDNEACYIY